MTDARFSRRHATSSSSPGLGRARAAREHLRTVKGSAESAVRDLRSLRSDFTPNFQRDRGGSVDEHAKTELELYVDNNEALYRQMYIPIVRNLLRKQRRGVYDSVLAQKAFLNLLEEGAKRYAKEFANARDWHSIFSPATRRALAADYVRYFETEAKLGNLDFALKK